MRFSLEVDLLKRVINAVKRIADEPVVVFEPAGMSIVVMDPAKVMLLQLSLRKSVFDNYEVSERKECCFSFADLGKYVSAAKGNADIEIEDGVRVLMPGSYGFKTFEFPLLEGGEKPMVPSALALTSRCKVDVGGLGEAMRDASKVGGDFLTFRVNEDMLEVISKGESASMVGKLGTGAVIASSFQEGDESAFAIDKLEAILTAGGEFTEVVQMEFAGEVLPIMFNFQVLFDGIVKGHVAPMVVKSVE